STMSKLFEALKRGQGERPEEIPAELLSVLSGEEPASVASTAERAGGTIDTTPREARKREPEEIPAESVAALGEDVAWVDPAGLDARAPAEVPEEIVRALHEGVAPVPAAAAHRIESKIDPVSYPAGPSPSAEF